MLAMPGLRTFSLSPCRDSTRVSCNAHGVFVGDVALLKRGRSGDETRMWSTRPIAELNAELTARYRLPIDLSTKVAALALIANALNRGDLAMAAIATVQMQFPDPPALGKGGEPTGETMRRALDLHRSRLLKVDWDPVKHPRAGTPPNPGWFAPVPTSPETPIVTPALMVGKPVREILSGEGGGSALEIPDGAGGLRLPPGLPRSISPSEWTSRSPPLPESVAPPEPATQARRFPKLPPLPPPPDPDDESDDYCYDRHSIEDARCDIFSSYDPRYGRACRARAADRLRLCVRNGGKPDPDEPPEFGWNDIPSDPATR